MVAMTLVKEGSCCWTHAVSTPTTWPKSTAQPLERLREEGGWRPLNRVSCPSDFWEPLVQGMSSGRHFYGAWVSSHSVHIHPEDSSAYWSPIFQSFFFSRPLIAPIDHELLLAFHVKCASVCNSVFWRIFLLFQGTCEWDSDLAVNYCWLLLAFQRFICKPALYFSLLTGSSAWS